MNEIVTPKVNEGQGKKGGCLFGCLIAIGTFLLIIVIAVILLPHFIDINQYRDRIEEMLSKELGSEVEIGNLELSLTSGISVTANDVRIKDPRIEGISIIFAPSIKIKLAILPILSKKVEVKHIILTELDTHIIEYADGTLNTPQGHAIGDYADGTGEGEAGAIIDDRIDKGLKPLVWKTGTRNEESRYTFLTTSYYTYATSIAISPGDVPDFMTIETILVKSIDIEGGTFTFSKEKSDGSLLELVSMAGIYFDIDSIVIPNLDNYETEIDLLSEISAKISGEVSGGEVLASPFSDLFLHLSIENAIAVLESAGVSIFGGSVSSEGVFGLAGDEPRGEMKLNVSKIRVNELLNAISDEEDLIVGTLNLTGDCKMPLGSEEELIQGLTGGGEVSVTDGYISDFSMREELARALGIPPELLPEDLDTGSFDFMGGRYNIASEKIYTNNFLVNSPTFDATASGYMGLDETLDFTGEIYLKDTIKELPLFKETTSRLGIEGQLDVIPYRITGTLDNVKFTIYDYSITQERLSDLLESMGIDTKEKREDIIEFGRDLLDF